MSCLMGVFLWEEFCLRDDNLSWGRLVLYSLTPGCSWQEEQQDEGLRIYQLQESRRFHQGYQGDERLENMRLIFPLSLSGRYVGSRPIKLTKSSWKDRNVDVVKEKQNLKKKMGYKYWTCVKSVCLDELLSLLCFQINRSSLQMSNQSELVCPEELKRYLLTLKFHWLVYFAVLVSQIKIHPCTIKSTIDQCIIFLTNMQGVGQEDPPWSVLIGEISRS